MKVSQYKKMVIIEPHGDDALISASTAFEYASNKDYDIHLITLGHSRSSEELSKYYRIDHYEYLDLDEIDYSLRPKVNTHDVHKKYTENTLMQRYVRNMIMEDRGVSAREAEIHVSNFKAISDLLENYIRDDNVIVVPYGLDHPYHILVSEMINSKIKELESTIPVIYYLEKPYLSKRYIRESLFVDTVSNDGTPSDLYPLYNISLVNPEKKEEAFKKVYPTEKSMLRFSAESILQDPDTYHIEDKYSNYMFKTIFR